MEGQRVFLTQLNAIATYQSNIQGAEAEGAEWLFMAIFMLLYLNLRHCLMGSCFPTIQIGFCKNTWAQYCTQDHMLLSFTEEAKLKMARSCTTNMLTLCIMSLQCCEWNPLPYNQKAVQGCLGISLWRSSRMSQVSWMLPPLLNKFAAPWHCYQVLRRSV